MSRASDSNCWLIVFKDMGVFVNRRRKVVVNLSGRIRCVGYDGLRIVFGFLLTVNWGHEEKDRKQTCGQVEKLGIAECQRISCF